jgi:hypothetical protein
MGICRMEKMKAQMEARNGGGKQQACFIRLTDLADAS